MRVRLARWYSDHASASIATDSIASSAAKRRVVKGGTLRNCASPCSTIVAAVGYFCTISFHSGDAVRAVHSDSAAANRRANSSVTFRETVAGGTRIATMTASATAKAIAVADSARVRKGRRGATALTTPNEAASTVPHPRASASNGPAPGIEVDRIQKANPSQMTASQSRPPDIHPSRAHTAMAGAMSTIVCSMGTSRRRIATSGTASANRSAKMIRAHPLSRGAATVTGTEAGVVGEEVTGAARRVR